MKQNEKQYIAVIRYFLKHRTPVPLMLMFLLANIVIAQVFVLRDVARSENELYSTIRSAYTLNNDHLFGSLTGVSRLGNDVAFDPDGNRPYTDEYLLCVDYFLQKVKELGRDEEVVYFSYNLSQPMFFICDESVVWGTAFGIEDLSFTDRQGLLLDGLTRGLQEDEIIVPYVYHDLFPIGSTLELHAQDSGEELIALKISGYYHAFDSYDNSYGAEDTFLNSHGFLLKNRTMEKLYQEYSYLNGGIFDGKYYGGMNIDNIVFSLKDYESYLNFQKKVEEAIQDINDFSWKTGGIYDIGVRVSRTDIAQQLKQIVLIKEISSFFCALLTMLHLPFLISYACYYLLRIQKDLRLFYIQGISLKKLHRTVMLILGGCVLLTTFLGVFPEYLVTYGIDHYLTAVSQRHLQVFYAYSLNGASVQTALPDFHGNIDWLLQGVLFLFDLLIIGTAVFLQRNKLTKGVRVRD